MRKSTEDAYGCTRRLHHTPLPRLREAARSVGGSGVEYEEKRVDESQDALDEALEYGSIVPIIVYPDGRVEEGKFEGVSG